MDLLERFLHYTTYDTQSDASSKTYPSTEKQWVLLKDLHQELVNLGVQATIDSYGYVIGRIPSNLDKEVPSLALIAHVDTSPDASGKNVQARVIKNYDGKEIVLNQEKSLVMDPKQFPQLKNHIGDDLVVTDGTTLLGADDKLGVAQIMTIVEYLQQNPNVPHGDIVIVFTPDEEVGTGTEYIDVKQINADFGFTLDGSKAGEIAYENFNAATVTIDFYGHSIHPGSAKNKLINSLDLAYEFYHALPKHLKPELTENYEGFNHLVSLNGHVESSKMVIIIRNHDQSLFQKQKDDFLNISQFMNQKYGYNVCDIKIVDSYFNMSEILVHHQDKMNIAKEAIIEEGLTPIIEPIRGGTDGARLSFMGLPCPNLGTGGYNFHGPYEYASVKEMYQTISIVKSIIHKFTQLSK